MPAQRESCGLSEGRFPEEGTQGPAQVDLWVWSLDGSEDVAGDLPNCLSPDEIARAAAFVNTRLRSRWTAARVGLRRLLGSRLGVPPETISFSLSEHGKPYLPDTDEPCFFNLSHSDAMAVLAVGDVPVGVDIERVGPLPEGVAETFFSADECAALAAVQPEEREHAFYRCWTAKEAVLKALGTGLSLSGKSFTVGFTVREDIRLLHADWSDTDTSSWQLAGFDPAPGYAGAVAAQTRGTLRTRLNRWNFNPF